MMQFIIKNQNPIDYFKNNTVEVKKAYFTLAVYVIFYLSLTLFQGILPFNQTLVGLVTLTQIFICLFLTISIGKLNDTSSILFYLISMAIMYLLVFNRIVCESANLEILIQVSTLIFFSISYYRISYQKNLAELPILMINKSNSILWFPGNLRNIYSIKGDK